MGAAKHASPLLVAVTAVLAAGAGVEAGVEVAAGVEATGGFAVLVELEPEPELDFGAVLVVEVVAGDEVVVEDVVVEVVVVDVGVELDAGVCAVVEFDVPVSAELLDPQPLRPRIAEKIAAWMNALHAVDLNPIATCSCRK